MRKALKAMEKCWEFTFNCNGKPWRVFKQDSDITSLLSLKRSAWRVCAEWLVEVQGWRAQGAAFPAGEVRGLAYGSCGPTGNTTGPPN